MREAGGGAGGTAGGPGHSGRRRWGQLLIVVAACTFASSQAVLKKLTTYGPTRWVILFLRGVLTIPLNSAIVYHRGGVPSLVRMLCGDAEPVAGKAGKTGKTGKAEGRSKRRRRRDRGEEGGSGGNSDKEELPSLLGTLYMYGRGVSGSLAVVFLVSAFTQYVYDMGYVVY